jgi:hypothetical protein
MSVQYEEFDVPPGGEAQARLGHWCRVSGDLCKAEKIRDPTADVAGVVEEVLKNSEFNIEIMPLIDEA